MNKKTILTSVVLILIFFLTKEVLATMHTTTFGNLTGTSTVEEFILSVIDNLKNILAVIAILFIVVGGIFYITAGGSEERIKTAKNIWVGSIIGLILALLAPTFLNEIRNIFLLPNGTLPTDINTTLSLTNIITKVLTLLLSIIGILAIISLVISGITYIFSFGDSSKAEKAKEMIKWSIFGMALAGASVIIVRQISQLVL